MKTSGEVNLNYWSIICADGQASYIFMGLPDTSPGIQKNGISYGTISNDITSTLKKPTNFSGGPSTQGAWGVLK